MLTEPHFTPSETRTRYLAQLARLLATARRIHNRRVENALNALIYRVMSGVN